MRTIGIVRLTADPILRRDSKGEAVTNFTGAWNYGEKPNFIRCVAFGRTAEIIANNVRKGHRLFIDGSLSENVFTTDKGTTYRNIEILVNQFQFIESKEAAENQPAAVSEESTTQSEEIGEEDLPF